MHQSKVDTTLGDRCGIWEHLHSLKEVKRGRGSVPDFILRFCVWCKSRELRGRVSPRFPFVTPVMESFTSDILQITIRYWAESHLESCQTSTMELFCGNSQRPKDINYFLEKAPPQLIKRISNAPPIGKVL